MADDESAAPVAGTELWDWSDPAGSDERFRGVAADSGGAWRLVALTQAARALGLQMRYDEGHDVLDGVAADPDGSSPEVSTRCALERGRLLRSAGREAEAAPLFEQAATEAAAAGLEALHADALHMLALLGDDPAEQLRRTQEALAVARAATADDARRWDASLLNNLGMAQHDLGDLDAAGEKDTYVDEELAILETSDPA